MAKHGKHARVQEADAELVDGASVQAAPEYDALENNAPEATKGISAHQKKSKRMRTVLIVVSAVLVYVIPWGLPSLNSLVLGALLYTVLMLVTGKNNVMLNREAN